MNTSRCSLLAMCLALLLIVPACSDDDENGPTGLTPPTYDDPQLQAMTTEGALVVQGLIDRFPNWMQGQLAKKDPTTPTWDPSCTCWRWFDTESDYVDPLHTWSRTWSFAMTFYQGDVPQMEFEGADNIGVVIGYGYSESDYRSEHNTSYTNIFFDLNLTGVPAGPTDVLIAGNGEGQFSAEITVGEDYTMIYEDLTLFLNMTLPIAGGCPSGEMSIDTDTTDFSVGLDGTATAHWTYITGPDQSQSGSFPLSCGK